MSKFSQNEEMFKHTDDIDKLVLVEIGPRFSLTPIKAFDGSLGGDALWQSGTYITPSKLRSKKYESFQKKRDEKEAAKAYKQDILEQGKHPDAYLQDAFEDEDENENDQDYDDEDQDQSGESGLNEEVGDEESSS